MADQKPFIIVLGNEKGGTGKSTVSMHTIIHLARLGFSIGSIDLDARQGTLTRYIENRMATKDHDKLDIVIPEHHPILKSTLKNTDEAEADENKRFMQALETLKDRDFIVIDTPGSDQYLSRLAHSHADLLITPLNDSFIDMDMLARIDPDNGEILRPSTYCEMVWEQKKQRALRGQKSFDWIVLRNRLSTLNAKNKIEMENALEKLAKRVGFRSVSGFSERVIFRELFLKGLTVLDLKDVGIDMTLSHVSARQELRSLIRAINLPTLQEKLNTQDLAQNTLKAS